ncbi:MAG: hypothetical protein AAB777_02300 [Patescibacteria group bacterium]
MNNKGKQIKIIWNDTKMFSPKNKDIELSIMETTGIFESEHDDYFLIKNPVTTNIKTGKKHPEQIPTFYLIPKGMIQDIQH